MPIVEVPGHGVVEFPDSMSDDEIVSAIKMNEASRAPSAPVKIGQDAWADTLRSELRGADWGTRNAAGAGTALSNAWEGVKQFVGKGSQQNIENNKIIAQEAPVGSIAGNVALTALPFGMVGPSVKGAAAAGAGMGAMQPVSGDQSLGNIAAGKAMNSGVGAVTGAAGQAVANKLLSGVSGAVSGLERKAQEKAAQVAASETASARSAAGNAAQNAYKQLEHLRELGANRALTDAEQLTVSTLERELSEKALEKLMPAAALKQSTSEAYQNAIKTEAERAAKYSAEKLSGEEAKQQLMARIKRYGPAAVGALIGNLVLPGLGGAVGGATTGLVLRPAIRSMINLSKNPAVQYGILSPINNSRLLASPLAPTLPEVAGQGLLNQ